MDLIKKQCCEKLNFKELERSAIKLIRKYGYKWMLYDDDAIGEVINAIASCHFGYDPNRGVKFSSYLISGVRRRIWRIEDNKNSNKTSDLLVDKGVDCSVSNIIEVIKKFPNLSEKEKNILEYYYFFGYNLVEIGAIYNISKQRVEQYLKRSLSVLRRHKHVFLEK